VTVRVAAAGDLHAGVDSAGMIRPLLAGAADQADVLVLAGDLTKSGRPEEARTLAGELRDLGVPIVAVLGNHDHHADRPDRVAEMMREAGVSIVEGDGVVLVTGGATIGVAGVKGFGGGFEGASGSDFGEPEMKAFIRHTADRAAALETGLAALRADVRIAVLHYSPIRDTLLGEAPELYPFLGSYLFAEAVDRAGPDLVVHGHAHHGTEKGVTPGGIEVRNVAQPVLGRAFAVYAIEPGSKDGRAGREQVAAGQAG
jgi:Icc-related predicted phosphoesterase